MPIHAEDLRRYLSESAGRPVRLRVNDNLHSLISTSRDGTGPGIRLSVHRMFLQADNKVINSLAQFIVKPTPEARRAIRNFINENRELITSARGFAPPRAVNGSPQGMHFNLASRASALNERYFDSSLRFGIIWGRGTKGTRRLQHHVTLGTWNERQRVVRIHPMLDNANVPPFYLDYVIYHEMVHIAVPSRVDGGRLLHHTEDFYDFERRYAHYEESQRWEKRWLRPLIRAWHGGSPLPAEAVNRMPR